MEESLSPRVMGRLAGILFTGSALLVLLALPTPGFADANRPGVFALCLLGVFFGLFTWFAPWDRWPRRVMLWLAPVAFGFIAAGNMLVPGPETFVVFFVLVFAWVGMSHPQRTCLRLAPVAAVAYVLPALVSPGRAIADLTGAAFAIPAAVGVGETIAWVTTRLRGTERALQGKQDQLGEAEAKYRALVERTPAITYVDLIDQETPGKVQEIYVSPQAEAILGYAPEELVRDPDQWERLLHPEDRDRALAADRQHYITGEPLDHEYRMITRDGRAVWVHDLATIVRDDTGRPKFSQGLIFDVNDRRRAEQALRESEARYRSLVDDVPVGLYRSTPAGEILDVNPAAVDLLGYTDRGALLAAGTTSIYVHPEDRTRWRELIEHDGIVRDFETRWRRADGTEIWVRDSAHAVRDDDGRIVYYEGSFQDITAPKRARQELEQALELEREASDRLRSLDEMKNAFLQAVSHELRTPLSSVLGYALTLQRMEDELPEEERLDMLGRLAVNARKLGRLLSDLLDVDRLAQGILEPRLEPTDVEALVRRVVKEADPRGHPVEVVSRPIVMDLDAPKVERIVENLLANAAKHTPPGTPIWVRVQDDGEGALILVEDEGPGVPEGLREAIFEPFRQGHQLHSYAPGTGIGLSLVARFAELHGGRAWVEGRPGGGSSFRVFFPRVETRPRQAS